MVHWASSRDERGLEPGRVLTNRPTDFRFSGGNPDIKQRNDARHSTRPTLPILNLVILDPVFKLMRRREFIALLGSAVASWPLAAHAQQPGRMWQIGWLGSGSAEMSADFLRGFRQGLKVPPRESHNSSVRLLR
jgi:hypothetical protein